MAIPIAVNIAYVFITNFKHKLLDVFQSQHSHKLVVWLRFMDDSFLNWEGTQDILLKPQLG